MVDILMPTTDMMDWQPSPVPKRNRRGCTRDEMFSWPLAKPADYAGVIGPQAFLQELIRKDPSKVARICRLPEARWGPGVWQLEHLRQVTAELQQLVLVLGDECTAETCPQMKATDEWNFLCAAHRTPQECCAVDYIVHTLEGTSAVLNSKRFFADRGSVGDSADKIFQSIARRLHRIFAHVLYHHRAIFDAFEARRHVCERFLKLVRMHDWIQDRLLIIPHSLFVSGDGLDSPPSPALGGSPAQGESPPQILEEGGAQDAAAAQAEAAVAVAAAAGVLEAAAQGTGGAGEGGGEAAGAGAGADESSEAGLEGAGGRLAPVGSQGDGDGPSAAPGPPPLVAEEPQ